MKLENQVVSLELAKKLKELGVPQESLFYWYDFKDGKTSLETKEARRNDCAWCNTYCMSDVSSAYTSAELGEMLPDNFHTFRKGDQKYWCGLDTRLFNIFENAWWNHEEEHTEADARAKMLIYLIEHNLITLS